MATPDWNALSNLIQQYSSFIITSHVRPDADALGSELGLRAILLALGKTVTIINASAPPANLEFMTPPGVIMKLNSDIPRGSIPAADAFVVVDTCAWQQLGAMSEIIRNSTAPRIVIDHHVSSDQLDAHEFKDVTAAATGELIFELAASLGITFDSTTANWLYAAIATDTGWFRFPSTSPRTMKIASALMEMGAQPHMVYGLVHEQLSMSRLRLGGRALSRTVADADG
ncbi:MAG: DHH family phosphoesterase, partial [Planctomycetaceae bacterium]